MQTIKPPGDYLLHIKNITIACHLYLIKNSPISYNAFRYEYQDFYILTR